MKRRNAECGKLRRPIKRNKIAEGMYGSNTFLYMKYLVLWAVVITADFMLDFRFEFLWPFWLLLRSVYDSFKYKGLAFSILFVCIAITSDLVCLFFIPVSWLFFLASTYVWVQYVWHADKGFCLPTIFLWMLFLYLEGAIRWKDDSKSIPHVDLCRPFAAHCIGYPVVTLGFGVKSYVGYRIRQRKQREVAKENEFYMQLLQLALPSEDPVQDELISQLPLSTETLHSDELGDIILPISSPMAAQQLQQQQMLLAASNRSLRAASNSNSSGTSSTSSSHTNSAKHLLNNSNNSILSNKSLNLSSAIGNGHHTINGVTPNNSTLSSTSSMSLSSTTSAATATTSSGMSSGNINNHIHNNTTSSSGVTLRANQRKSLDRNDHRNSGESASTSRSTTTASTANGANMTKRTTYQGSVLRDASKITESITTTIWSTIRYRLFGNGGDGNSNAANNDSRSMNGGANSSSNFTTATTTSKRNNNCDDDDIDNMSNDIESTHTVTSISNVTSSGGARQTTEHNSNSKNKEYRNNNGDIHSASSTMTATGTATAAAAAVALATTLSSNAAWNKERDNSKSSNNNFSTDVNNDTHYHQQNHHNNHIGNNKDKHFNKVHPQNGNMSAMEIELNLNSVSQHENNAEIFEKGRGRRNKAKQKDSANVQTSRDNQQIGGNVVNNNNNNNNNNINNSSGSTSNHHHHNNQHSYVPEIKENGTSGHHHHHHNTSNASATPTVCILPQTCESCLRLESDLKKMRNDFNQLKQYEADLRQKCEINANFKSCLQAKQKENDEMEKKIQELTNARQFDRQSLQQTERRLGEERRQKQSLDSLLNNERKQRKQVEEKAARTECGESCKQRKQLLESECKQLRRELGAVDEIKKSAEQQSRNYEQELRKFENELRNRESREGTEVLMSALQAMQDKNATLEKNLSAETRVKLDLFSALGEAKRQLEIRENLIRQKDKEVLELKAKIAQLFAVMPSVPNESFCMTQCSSSGGSSMLRLNDTPPLQGPSSPLTHAHMSLGGSPLMNQLQNLSVFTSTSNSMSPQTPTSQCTGVSIQQQQQQQQQYQVGHLACLIDGGDGNGGGGGGGSSNLDPNAIAYTPKNVGAEA